MHPGFAPKFLKCFALVPNVVQEFFFHVVKLQAGNDLGGMTRKRATVRRNQHDFASPAAHARFWVFCVVIRYDVLDANFSAQTFFRGFHFRHEIIELLPGRKQKISIRKSPAVILHVRKFDAGCGRRLRNGQHRVHLMKIVAMENKIQCDADWPGFEPFEDAKLLRMCLCSRDFFGDGFGRCLKAQLKMVETGRDKRIEF